MPTTSVTTHDGTADAYETGEGPGVLIFMDAFGVRPQLERMADRIAAQGYRVLVPNVFYREAASPLLASQPDLSTPEERDAAFAVVGPLMQAYAPELAVRDSGPWLDALPDGPVAVLGYCMGVALALRTAAAHPDRVVAVGGFHGGRLVGNAPDSPHRVVATITAEVYLGHADEDGSNTPEQIAALDEALDAAGVTHVTEVYAGAPHGYSMADTAMHDAAAATRHERAVDALLARCLPTP